MTTQSNDLSASIEAENYAQRISDALHAIKYGRNELKIRSQQINQVREGQHKSLIYFSFYRENKDKSHTNMGVWSNVPIDLHKDVILAQLNIQYEAEKANLGKLEDTLNTLLTSAPLIETAKKLGVL